MTWTIPLVMSNLNNNPANQYGLVGVVTLNQTGTNPNTYTGTVVFTKPPNAFANQQFALQNIQYPYPNPPYQGQLYFEIGPNGNGTTPVQLAQQFGSNGGYNPNGNNPPVNTAGQPPVFAFHAPWDGQSSVIASGQARLPQRLLAALGQGNSGNSGWQQILFNAAGGNTGTGGNLTIASQITQTDGTMLYLAKAEGNVVFQLNLTPVTGVVIILNMQSLAASPWIGVFASTTQGGPQTSIGDFAPAVGQYSTQAFFIPSRYLQQGNNWITVQNSGVANVYFQKATFAW